MHVIDDLHMTMEDLRPVREMTNWENDLIGYELARAEREFEPDLEQ